MLTYQDYERAGDKLAFLHRLVEAHETSEETRTARLADLYDRQRNVTINENVPRLFTLGGAAFADVTASNNRIASNFFNRLNTQRASYLLGNGVSFTKPGTKALLGQDADTRIAEAGRLALIHGRCYLFFNVDRLHVFPLTQFAPLVDEETGALRAGLRYWRVDAGKPAQGVFYEEDGQTALAEADGGWQPASRKTPYRLHIARDAVGVETVCRAENYARLPIVPLYGSRLRQSTLVGMRQAIDSYDLIRSGFANDLTDCAQIYWLLENAGSMTDAELARFRDRLKLAHIAAADTGGEGRVTPYTQEVPYAARTACLDVLRQGIYEDFGGLDVRAIGAGSRTATEIQAAYQALDEQADDFEYQVIDCLQSILALIGIEDTPLFKRNRIVNQLEQVQTLMLEAPYLDRETLLHKLPNLTPEEAEAALARRGGEGKGGDEA